MLLWPYVTVLSVEYRFEENCKIPLLRFQTEDLFHMK